MIFKGLISVVYLRGYVPFAYPLENFTIKLFVIPMIAMLKTTSNPTYYSLTLCSIYGGATC